MQERVNTVQLFSTVLHNPKEDTFSENVSEGAGVQ